MRKDMGATAPGPVLLIALIAACGSDPHGTQAQTGMATGRDAGHETGSTSDASSGSGESDAAQFGPALPPFTDAQLTAQGCHLDRYATPYMAGPSGSTALASPPAGLGMISPCFHLTGLGAAETSIIVTTDGDVFYAPTFTDAGVGLLRTNNSSESWDFLLPKLPNGYARGREQPYLYRDPASDRIFFSTTAFSGHDLSLTSQGSADGGGPWSYERVAKGSIDWLKIFSAPPVTGTTQGYPDLVYLSAPSPTSTPYGSVKPDHQEIFKSLDGGNTWQSAGTVSLKTADWPGCAPNEWIIAGNAVGSADGTLFQSYRLCTHLGIAVSTDEGQTWAMQQIPNTELQAADVTQLAQIIYNPNWLLDEPLAVDTDGTLYAVWPDSTWTLRFAYSKDHAQTWSTPIVVQAPQVQKSVYGSIAIKAPGTIAISYHGSIDGTKYDGYVAESLNAFDAAPTFLTSIVNDPGDPLFPVGFDAGYAGTNTNGDLNEIIMVKYAPDGDIWASFVKDMCPGVTTSTANCTWDVSAHANSMYQGAVGRLVHR